MLERDVISLVQKVRAICSELPEIEVKAAKKGCPKVLDSLSSFANQSGGGVILFGVDEENGFEICGVYDTDDLMIQITNQSQQMEPVLRPLYTVAKYEEKWIVAAEIQEVEPDQKPCFYTGKGRLKGSYVRVGEQDLPMTEYEVYSYEAFKRRTQDELRTNPRPELGQLDKRLLEEYFVEIKRKKRNLSQMDSDEILKLQGIIDQNGQSTLAGNLLLGLYPQANFPQLCITAIAVQGTEIGDLSDYGARFIDNERIEGTLPQMLEGAMAFIQRNTPVATIIDPVTGKREDRPMYPPIAVRELVLNALIHRDYSFHTETTPITIRLFSDRLEIENPGGLYGRMTPDMLGRMSAETRNPFIAVGMEVLAEAENRFSGIPTVRRFMKEAQLPAPVFEVYRGVFKAALYNRRTNEMKDVSENDLSLQVLAFCSVPRSRKELEMRFSEITIEYLMNKTIKHLIRDGRIALTLPDKPKSKFQKYYTKKM